MILFLSSVLISLVYMNFSLMANKSNFVFTFNMFMEIKVVTLSFTKLMLSVILFLSLNHMSYIYYSVGLTMVYGYVLIYAVSLVGILWLLWMSNHLMSMLGHFLPMGIEGVLKSFTPVLEIVGVLIRPMTLAIRLATNISRGHVASLMPSYFVFNVTSYMVVSISILLLGLYFIESLACLIQAYVFWSLLYIYVMEVEI